jgi:spore maturation protein SpmA
MKNTIKLAIILLSFVSAVPSGLGAEEASAQKAVLITGASTGLERQIGIPQFC